MKSLIPAITKVIGWFAKFMKENQTFAKIIIGVIVVVGVLAALFGFIGLVSSVVASGWATMVIVGGFLKAMFFLLSGAILKTTIALLTSPFLWIPLAIAAVAIAIVMLIKHFDLVKEKVIQVWNYILEIWTGMPGWVKWLVAIFMPFVGIALAIGENWEWLKEKLGQVFDWFAMKIEWIKENTPDWVKDMFSGDTDITAENTGSMPTAETTGSLLDSGNLSSNMTTTNQHEVVFKLPKGVSADVNSSKTNPGDSGLIMQGLF
jgi:hypothetical protein